MFRVDRQVTSDVEDAHEPKFTQSDAQVRAIMCEMAKFLLAQARDTAAREHLLEELISRFGSQGLSMTLMKQESSALRSDVSLGGGVSPTTDTKSGGRFGLSVTGAMQKGWSTQVKEKDSTGSYRINNVRSGWVERNKGSVDLTANAYVKTIGLPSTPLGQCRGIVRRIGWQRAGAHTHARREHRSREDLQRHGNPRQEFLQGDRAGLAHRGRRGRA